MASKDPFRSLWESIPQTPSFDALWGSLPGAPESDVIPHALGALGRWTLDKAEGISELFEKGARFHGPMDPELEQSTVLQKARPEPMPEGRVPEISPLTRGIRRQRELLDASLQETLGPPDTPGEWAAAVGTPLATEGLTYIAGGGALGAGRMAKGVKGAKGLAARAAADAAAVAPIDIAVTAAGPEHSTAGALAQLTEPEMLDLAAQSENKVLRYLGESEWTRSAHDKLAAIAQNDALRAGFEATMGFGVDLGLRVFGSAVRAGARRAVDPLGMKAIATEGIGEGTREIGPELADVHRTPHPELPETPRVREEVGPPLPMDEASRMARAREQGFDTGTTLYHGTDKDFDAFDLDKIGTASDEGFYGRGISASTEPGIAEEFARPPLGVDEGFFRHKALQSSEGANIKPLLARGNFLDMEPQEARGVFNRIQNESRRANPQQATEEVTREFVDAGYDGLRIHHPEGGEYLVFDPSNLRSKFARFDPENIGKPDLLGGARHEVVSALAGAGVGATAGAAAAPEGEKLGGALTGAGAGFGFGAAGARLAPKAARRLKDMGEVGSVSMGEIRAPSGVGSFARRFFRSGGNLPRSVHMLNVAKEGGISSRLSGIRYTLRDYDRAMRGSYGRRIPAEAEDAVNSVLGGDAPISGLPEPIRPHVEQMRQDIDGLSEELLRSGMVEGDVEATIRDNIGFYLHRSYQAFDDARWADKVPEDVKNRLVSLLREEMPGIPEEEVLGKLDVLLNRADSPMSFIAGGKLGSKDLSILMKRKDIGPELRAAMGEYTNPRVNYVRSMTKMANMVENHRFLTQAKEAGTGTFFFDRPTRTGGVSYSVPVASKGSKAMDPLSGVYTSKDIAQAFQDAQEVDFGWLMRRYMMANGVVKVAKTIFSPVTHVRNFVANPSFLLANGHFGLFARPAIGAVAGGAAGRALAPEEHKGVGTLAGAYVGFGVGGAGTSAKGVKALLANAGLTSSRKFQGYYRHLQELGVVDQSVYAKELRDTLRDATRRGLDEVAFNPNPNVFQKLNSAAQGLYRAEDDFWKVIAFEAEKARYTKAMPDMPVEAIERKAAAIVRNTLPTYSNVPKAVRMLRRSPLFGTFVSFPAEVYRTLYNSLSLAKGELADPKLRSVGAKRLAGLAAMAAAVPTITMASRHINGIGAGEDRDIRRFLAPWSKFSNIMYLSDDKEGSKRFVDLSYTDPYSYLRNPLIAFMQGEDWDKALKDGIMEAYEPFLGGEILATHLGEVIFNPDQRVYNPESPLFKRGADITEHMWDAFEPGAVSQFGRLYKGVKGQKSRSGFAYSAKNEVAAMMSGFRMQTVDVKQSLGFNLREAKRRLGSAQRQITSAAARRGNVSDRQLEKGFESSEQRRQEILGDVYEDVRAAIRLGMTRTEVDRALRGTFSRELTRNIMAGYYEPYSPSKQFWGGLDFDEPGEQLRRRRALAGFERESGGFRKMWDRIQ